MEHDSTTCPYCGDLSPESLGRHFLDAFQRHVLAKQAELESRIQQQEWNHTRLGPRQEESNVPDPRVVETLKRLGLKEPECQLCFDEEGSYACIRPAHGYTSAHKHDFSLLPPNDDEQQCDTDCRENWHRCSICGKTRGELGIGL